MMQDPFLMQLEKIRAYEIHKVISYLSPDQLILEIGGGAGWQARELILQGFQVISIDIPISNYKDVQEWPIIQYDGQHLPIASNSIDVIYSSNTLEHIPHIEVFQIELQRVLKSSGTSIHLMPTTAWRFWTAMTYYAEWILMTKQAFSKLRRSKSNLELFGFIKDTFKLVIRRTRRLKQARHGEFGSVVTELYYFSRYRWRTLFQNTGWNVVNIEPNRLFYTGHNVLGDKLPIAARKRLSHLLGNACMIYILSRSDRDALS